MIPAALIDLALAPVAGYLGTNAMQPFNRPLSLTVSTSRGPSDWVLSRREW